MLLHREICVKGHDQVGLLLFFSKMLSHFLSIILAALLSLSSLQEIRVIMEPSLSQGVRSFCCAPQWTANGLTWGVPIKVSHSPHLKWEA